MVAKVPTLSKKVTIILALQTRERFSAQMKDVHSAFARLQELHPGVLDELVFSTNDVYPYSPRLEQVLGVMRYCGSLEGRHHFGAPNLPDQYRRVSPRAKREATRCLQSLDPDYASLLLAMAKEFEQFCPDK